MQADGSNPENPFRLLVCDADALIQVICADQIELLKKLEKVYGIRAIITEAVEDEITNPAHRRASLVGAPFQKAINSDVLTVLSRRTIGMFTTNDPHSIYDSIELRGQEYSRIVQRGEAYTHAAAVVLRAAAMSNDASAVRALDRSNVQYGAPVVRTYPFEFRTICAEYFLWHVRRPISMHLRGHFDEGSNFSFSDAFLVPATPG